MSRKTKRDWLLAGTELLASVGAQGLTIEALCQQVELTKGSFYHHFAGYEEFKASLLAFYEEEGTLEIIERLAHLPTPQAKIRGLVDIIVAASTQFVAYPETSIRAWALQDEAVREVQMRVDGRRLAYLETLLLEIVGDPAAATCKAQLMYAILVGAEQMQPPIVGLELRALFDDYLSLLNME